MRMWALQACVFIMISCVCAGCGDRIEKSSASRERVERCKKDLLQHLREVSSKESALKMQAVLEEDFLKLAHLMVTAGTMQQYDATLSQKLEDEMQRLLLIPGVEEILKKSQDKGFLYLSRAVAR